MRKTRNLFNTTGDIKDRNSKHIAEAEQIKKKW